VWTQGGYEIKEEGRESKRKNIEDCGMLSQVLLVG